jgi:GNAT superfamily N-acetyltransferase
LIRLSDAAPGDVPAIAEIFAEMSIFYGTPASELDSLEVRQQQISAALFADIPAARALLAWDGSDVVGCATYSFLWPAVGLSSSLFLKELYVAATARRQGVGNALMHGLFEIAAQRRCSRVEWMTDVGNKSAQAFYAGLGVPASTSKVHYRLAGDELGGAGLMPGGHTALSTRSGQSVALTERTPGRAAS